MISLEKAEDSMLLKARTRYRYVVADDKPLSENVVASAAADPASFQLAEFPRRRRTLNPVSLLLLSCQVSLI